MPKFCDNTECINHVTVSRLVYADGRMVRLFKHTKKAILRNEYQIGETSLSICSDCLGVLGLIRSTTRKEQEKILTKGENNG